MVFFPLLELLLSLFFFQLYVNDKKEYHKELLHTMQLCSYSMDCKQFKVAFVPKNQEELNVLNIKEDTIDALFLLPESKKFDMSLHYSIKSYHADIDKILKSSIYQFIGISFVLLLISLFFTNYTLKPIRKALTITDEFMKDILHDFNTPMAAMLLNINLLNRANGGENSYTKRLTQSLNTMLLLERNLKTFLYASPSQMSEVDIALLCQERLTIMQSIYPELEFTYEEHKPFSVLSNEDLLVRIIDNLLSNASKYNSPKGRVSVRVDTNFICIEDTGKGIKDVDKVLQRYYKEQDRGLGLGLHIVQKLTKELGIRLIIKSKLKVGTTVSLYFKEKEKNNA